MRINVAGKRNKQGNRKKDGRPYNLNEIHYLGRAYGVEGLGACTLVLDPVQYPFDSIIVGKDYNVEFDGGGYIIDFTPCK